MSIGASGQRGKLFRSLTAAIAAAALIVPWVSVGGQTASTATNWPSFLGNESGTSYSPLDQINRSNVRNLAPSWMYAIKGPVQNSTPVVVDGVLYLTLDDDHVIAFDAVSGKMKWSYGGGSTSTNIQRGSAAVAVGFGMVFLGTRENHLIALDAATGKEVWDVEIEDRDQCSCMPSHGLLIVKDKIVVGVRGDNLHRAYINAFDAKTGKHIWRWYVIPGPGEPGHESWPENLWRYGGGSTWHSGTYDPKLNLIYWGTANPQPIMGSTEPDTKLWTDSLVAIDADTGKMRWGYQELPADAFDYDSATEAMLIDAPVNGVMTPLVVHSVKNGHTYVLNRATGAVVAAYPFADYVTWNRGLAADGKPIGVVKLSKDASTLICPTYYGARAANHGTYSPRTGLWYGSSTEYCTKLRAADPPAKVIEGRGYSAGRSEGEVRSPQSKPFVGAFDPVSGKRRWAVTTRVANFSSLMATGGDLVFGSDIFGEMWALDAETGKRLWTFKLGAQNANSAVSYSVGGKQYIAVVTGGGGGFPSRMPEIWPEEAANFAAQASSLVVFSLYGQNSQ